MHMLYGNRIKNHRTLTLPLKFPHFPAIQTRTFADLSSSLLSLCRNPQHLRQIHARFIIYGLHQNFTLSSKLVDSYAKLGLPHLSQQVFNSITNPNAVSHNTVLENLWKLAEYEKTLSVYQEIVRISIYPDEDAYFFVIKSCSYLPDVKKGKKIHGHVLKLGLDSFDAIVCALDELYGKLGGEIENEEEVFDKMPVRYFKHFKLMKMENIEPDSSSLINLLRSSVELNSLMAGKAVHCVVAVTGMCRDLSVNTALLSMYSKLTSLKDARALFEEMPERDCVVWNIMISSYAQHNCAEESFELLRRMVKEGVRADLFTAIASLSSIAQLKSIKRGKEMHSHVLRNCLDYQVSVLNSLIDMYCQCGYLNYAREIFDMVGDKTVVSWSSMIKGYVTHDQSLEALILFARMKEEGTKVDFVTIINILPACVNIGALEKVKYLHGHSVKLGLNSLSSVDTAILVSYAKCGCIEMARKLFEEEIVYSKDMITWNSIINAYAKHGNWSECFKLYNKMKQSNMRPDQVTFIGLLTACVNSGLVEEGRKFFKEMKEYYNCEPYEEHYASMVNLLGRAGFMAEARKIVKDMPFKPDARVWGPLLSACKMHSETELAESTAEKLITMEPKNAGNYVLLSNIYAAAGKWDRVAKLRSFLRDKGLKKTPGCSWIETGRGVNEFRVADRSHPKADDIYAMLGILELEIKEAKRRNSENNEIDVNDTNG